MGIALNTDKSMYNYVAEGLGYVRDKTLFYFKGRKIKKAAFLKEVDKFCTALCNMGVGQGDVVSLNLPNIPNAAIVFYAINKLGAIANLIHPLMPPAALSEMVKASDAKALVTFDGYYADNIGKLDISAPVIVCRASDYLPKAAAALYRRKEQKITFGDKVVSFKSVMRRVKPYSKEALGSGEDCAVYMHSGGTTGMPKTIALSNKSFNELTESLKYVIKDYDAERDVSLMVLPIFHGFGLGVCLHSMLSCGIESVMIPRYRTKEVLKAVGRRKVTIMAGVPLMYKKLLGGGKLFANMAGVRNMFCGGDKLTSSLKESFDTRLKEIGNSNKLLEGYGLTECVTVCCVNDPADSYIKGCLGYPLHGMNVAVLGSDGALAPAETTGEILVAGNTLMIGYINADNGGVFIEKEGVKWLRTGDIGHIDDKGRLFYNDRGNSAVKISGVVVYPQEIAEVVGDLPFVSESCAVKISEGDREYMRLYCVAQGDKEELKTAITEHCKDKLIVYARPKEIVFLDNLPRTPVGKVDTAKLAEYKNA